MMISPETYYEFELKGKTAAEIEKEIQSLRKTISDLKYRMEDPAYKPSMVCPSDDTVLYWTREYLAMAKKALLEAGGEYEENGTTMIVSRGLARESTKVPRIFNRPELVLIELK